MPLIDFPPGVVNFSSRKKNTGNWREVNLVRWDGPTLLPVGGWSKVNYTAFASPVRTIHSWGTIAGARYTAFLCEEHCYVDVGDGILLDITPVDGLEPPPAIQDGGYGDEDYNEGLFGTPRTGQDRGILVTYCFTVDNWGEDLRVMTSVDGRLLGWSPSTPGTKLQAVANAPVSNRSFLVTPERFIVIFGAGGVPHRFQWCDQENDTVWNALSTTKAGEFDIQPMSAIVTAKLAPNGILVFTTRSSYLVSFVGLPYVYSCSEVSECQSPYSYASAVRIPDGLLWVAPNGFWLFNGSSIAPVSCPIWDWIKSRISLDVSRRLSAMVTIPTAFEVWWFFSTGNEGVKNDTVVIFNYNSGAWSMGKINRQCGVSSANDYTPLMSDGVNVYSHETGNAYPGAPELPWAESYTLSIDTGSRMATIKQMLPEFIGDNTGVEFILIKNNNPSSVSDELLSAPKRIRSNGYVDVRETARNFRLRVKATKTGRWSLGPVEIDIAARGMK